MDIAAAFGLEDEGTIPQIMSRINVKDRSSRRRTETPQGNLRPSRAADDDGRQQGSTRTRLKL